jgi:hypothetical protein
MPVVMYDVVGAAIPDLRVVPLSSLMFCLQVDILINNAGLALDVTTVSDHLIQVCNDKKLHLIALVGTWVKVVADGAECPYLPPWPPPYLAHPFCTAGRAVHD